MCNKCGSCCKALVVNVSPQEATRYKLREYPFDSYSEEDVFLDDYLFIATQLKPLSHKEALKRNPNLKDWFLKKGKHFVYSCPLLGVDNLCTVHGKKGKNGMCDGFPWYGRKPTDMYAWYSPDCFFIGEVASK